MTSTAPAWIPQPVQFPPNRLPLNIPSYPQSKWTSWTLWANANMLIPTCGFGSTLKCYTLVSPSFIRMLGSAKQPWGQSKQSCLLSYRVSSHCLGKSLIPFGGSMLGKWSSVGRSRFKVLDKYKCVCTFPFLNITPPHFTVIMEWNSLTTLWWSNQWKYI